MPISDGETLHDANLKDGRATRIIHQLIADYDILIEQFRPGVMAKFSLDYESLKKVKPSLIYCSLPATGRQALFAIGQVMISTICPAQVSCPIPEKKIRDRV